MNKEEWRPIPGYEHYFASNLGNIGSDSKGKFIILKPKKNRAYLRVTLCVKQKRKNCSIHRLVFAAFKGQIREGYVIDHIDGNTSNNNISNLRSITVTENNRSGYERKRLKGNTSSKYPYVTIHPLGWLAWCSINHKRYHLSYFKNEDEAGRVAEEASRGIYPQKFIDRLAKKGIVIGK